MRFVKTLNLGSSNMKQNTHFYKVLRPTIGRCFELTRRDMLEKLSSESANGRIVLAGDGQFDSPGSSATTCTYTLMVLGVEQQEGQDARDKSSEGAQQQKSIMRNCGYVLNQAVIDRRHADDVSVNMERIGLHWAMQPIVNAGLRVTELVTDDHVQIVSDFKKIKAASDEHASNQELQQNNRVAMDIFKDSLSSALKHFHPHVNVREEKQHLLEFYGAIIHSNDIWHRAKNLLKNVSAIAERAPSKEQPTYKRYARMLRNFLWECAEGSAGDSKRFVEMWTTIVQHLQDDHRDCESIHLHSKTQLMDGLDQSTRSFASLMTCVRKVETSASQLCRFRNTGILESYNGLCLTYCPKRIFLPYETMVMRRELCALDHNHHVFRAYLTNADGKVCTRSVYKKSTKAHSLRFLKEEKTYDYIPHLMAAILHERYRTELILKGGFGPTPRSANNPKRIQSSLTPRDKRETFEETCSKWLARRGKGNSRMKSPSKATKSTGKRKRRQSSSESDNMTTSESESDESESEETTDEETGGDSSSDEPSEDNEGPNEQDPMVGSAPRLRSERSAKEAGASRNQKRNRAESADEEWRPKKTMRKSNRGGCRRKDGDEDSDGSEDV